MRKLIKTASLCLAFLMGISILWVRPVIAEDENLLPNGDFSEIQFNTAKGWTADGSAIYQQGDLNFTIGKGTSGNIVSEEITNLKAGKYEFGVSAGSSDAEVTIEVLDGKEETLASETVAVASKTPPVIVSGSFTFNGGSVKVKISVNATKNCTLDDAYLKFIKETEQEEEPEIEEPEIEETIFVFTENGAEIRADGDNSGLRFRGKVDKQKYDEYANNPNYENVHAGMIIAPIDYVDYVGEFTFSKFAEKDVLCLDIKAETWNNLDTAEEDGYYGFNCAIVKILPTNVDREFCARSYFSYTENGVEKYLYAEFVPENNIRSVYFVASMAKNDIDNFESYQVDAINGYCDSFSILKEYNEDMTSGFTENLTAVPKGYLNIEFTSSGSVDFSYKVYINGSSVYAQEKDGYYELSETSDIKIEFTIEPRLGSLLAMVKSIKIKWYKTV